jgi:hypothetical protein
LLRYQNCIDRWKGEPQRASAGSEAEAGAGAEAEVEASVASAAAGRSSGSSGAGLADMDGEVVVRESRITKPPKQSSASCLACERDRNRLGKTDLDPNKRLHGLKLGLRLTIHPQRLLDGQIQNVDLIIALDKHRSGHLPQTGALAIIDASLLPVREVVEP